MFGVICNAIDDPNSDFILDLLHHYPWWLKQIEAWIYSILYIKNSFVKMANKKYDFGITSTEA